MKKITVADIEGDWKDQNWESGLVKRCQKAWNKSLDDLTNQEIATFLRQEIAVDHILPLAIQRVNDGYDDDTEMFEGELKKVMEKINKSI